MLYFTIGDSPLKINFFFKENYRMGGAYKWPAVEETKEFRRRTRELVEHIIKRTDFKLPIKWDSDFVILILFFKTNLKFFIFSGLCLWVLNMRESTLKLLLF